MHIHARHNSECILRFAEFLLYAHATHEHKIKHYIEIIIIIFQLRAEVFLFVSCLVDYIK